MNAPVPRLLRLVQRQVAVGQPLPFGVRDEHGKLLLARGHVVADDAQLAALLDRGAYVDAEEAREALKAGAGGNEAAAPKATLFDLWEQMIWRLQRVLHSVAEPGLPQRVAELAGALVALQRRDADIGIYLAMRQDPKRLSIYGLTHSLYSAMACSLAAERLAWSEDDALCLVSAALTMNLPIIELQGRLATQRDGPTPSQLERVRAHPAAAADALAAAGVANVAWLDAVRQHHERRDGQGYPSGLREVSPLALALRQADVLLAKVSPRAGRAAMPIQRAHRELFAEDGGGPFASALIKEFGIFPPGDFVQLKSGEMAVVVRRGATATTPEVAAITDRSGMPVTSSVRRNTAKPDHAIVGPAADKTLVLRVQPERLFGLVT
jgi:HD-GYP domain-containing protein (c-di-GMP phosphodiesterase class II)